MTDQTSVEETESNVPTIVGYAALATIAITGARVIRKRIQRRQDKTESTDQSNVTSLPVK